jgi:hypothetical protein
VWIALTFQPPLEISLRSNCQFGSVGNLTLDLQELDFEPYSDVMTNDAPCFKSEVRKSVRIQLMLQTGQSSESLVARGWALLFYGSAGAAGLAVVVLHLWRHGITQPETFVAPLAILSFLFVWLLRTVESGTPSKVKFERSLCRNANRGR